MFWILLLLSTCPARADAPHVPPEMKQKYEDVSAALRASYEQAQRKVKHADESSDLVHAALENLRHLWKGAKAKGRGALVYLDHQFHAHVLGPEANGHDPAGK